MSNCKHGAPGTCWVCYNELEGRFIKLEEKYIALKKERAEEPLIEPNDEGPAFPMIDESGGMKLRDYFAAKAMQGMTADPLRWASHVNPKRETLAACLSDQAYEMADAMLKYRKEKP